MGVDVEAFLSPDYFLALERCEQALLLFRSWLFAASYHDGIDDACRVGALLHRRNIADCRATVASAFRCHRGRSIWWNNFRFNTHGLHRTFDYNALVPTSRYSDQ